MKKNIQLTVLATTAVLTLSFMAFVVLPQMPQLGIDKDVPVANAWDGDAGGGCCGGESPGGGYNGGGESPGGGTYTPIYGYCEYFTASPNPVTKGGSTTLSWSVKNAERVVLEGYGDINANDSKVVTVNENKTFSIQVYARDGITGCQASVTVTIPPPPAAKCESLTINTNKVPSNGGNVTLTWKTINATSVSIDNGIGNVSANDSTTVFVNGNTTFTLTATGTGGSDSCTVTITKETDSVTPRCDYLRVSDDEVEEGDYVTLTWETTNATSVSINNGIGNVSLDGSKTVEIDDDITYILTASGTNGSDSCSVSVDIEEEEKKNTPKCELDISKDRVNKGDKVTLSWETKYVDEIVIKDDRGNTIFDTDDYSSSKRKKYFDGEIDVIINQSTEFRMTAYGEDGGKKTCKVDVDVDNDIAIYEKRDQALVIALTQVPYTGFEAGSFLTFLFYAVLTLWALFIAYILVIKKGSVLGFSLYGKNAGMSEADVANRKKVEALVAKYAGQNK